ncbi:MAG: 50S ribosomal protein L6 [Candidatus Micrarchaeota archaeon]
MEIPQGITVRVDGSVVVVKGPQGEVSRQLGKGVSVKVGAGGVEVECADKAVRGTTEAVIRNMVAGAAGGYTKNLKLLHAHFPITIEVKGNDITIKNFLGEKQPRKTKLIGNTKVVAKGQAVTVSGPDKEAVGQTVANIRSAMRIRDKDGRIFQDGLYDAE